MANFKELNEFMKRFAFFNWFLFGLLAGYLLIAYLSREEIIIPNYYYKDTVLVSINQNEFLIEKVIDFDSVNTTNIFLISNNTKRHLLSINESELDSIRVKDSVTFSFVRFKTDRPSNDTLDCKVILWDIKEE